MNILFIDPPRISIKKGNIWKTVNRSLPSLGLAYIAAYLEKQGLEAKILDLRVEEYSIDQVLKKIKLINPEYIGFTATTPQINTALSIAAQIKKHFTNIKIIFGGPHPNIFPDVILDNNFVDMVVRGEGEFTIHEIVRGECHENILGLSYKHNKNIIHNDSRPPIQDLDTLPFPARHLIPVEKYRPSSGNYIRLPFASIITSRGCPGKCTFCHTGIHGKKIRYRSAENIANEIKTLINQYKIKEVSFYDDTFTAYKKNVQELCKILIHEKIDITWSCMSRVDYADFETLKLMKKAGCHQIGYGIESGDETILENIKKRISFDSIRDAVKWTKNAKIDVRAMFMFGNPGETRESIENTINFGISLDPDIYVFNIATPLPGTEMFYWADKNGYLVTKDWDKYDLGQTLMNLPTVSTDVINRYYKKAYRRSYLRLSYIIKQLPKLNSYEAIKMRLNILQNMVSNFV